MKIKSICNICGKEILCFPSRIGKYCSRECYGKSLIGRNMPWLSKWRHSKRSEEVKENIKKAVGKGKNCRSWRGGKIKDSSGYVQILFHDHPYSKKSGYIQEHRLIMEKFLGRYLLPKEKVHHRNGINDDNRIENLQLVSETPHYGEVKCPHCNYKFLIH